MNKQFSPSDLVEMLTQKVTALSVLEKLFVVGITGLDASGKSQIAKSITSKLQAKKKRVVFLSGDSFQYPRKYKEDFVEASWALQHIRRTINFRRMVDSVLKPLQSHPTILSLDVVNYDTGTSSQQLLHMDYPVIVIIESIYLFQEAIVPYLNYKIFLEISMDTALARAKVRPRDLELYGNIEGIAKKYTTRNFAGYQLFEQQHKPKQFADVIISNDDWEHPVIQNYDNN